MRPRTVSQSVTHTQVICLKTNFLGYQNISDVIPNMTLFWLAIRLHQVLVLYLFIYLKLIATYRGHIKVTEYVGAQTRW